MRRISVIYALLALCMCARGQVGVQFLGPDDILRRHRELMAGFKEMDEQFRRMAIQPLPEAALTVRARCEPAKPVVGERCDLILELDIDRRVDFEKSPQVSGVPAGKDVPVVYGSLENLPDEKSDTAGHVVKRIRLPMRFRAPYSCEVSSLRIEGEVVAGGAWLYSFNRRFAPLRFEARPLPEEGRPANYSGAVGKDFSIKQSLNRDHVRLHKEFVTVTYTLEYDDYCPFQVFPDIGRFSKDFKVYPPKEVERTANGGTNRVTWTQDLIPLAAQATNTASVSFSYYNPQTKRYEMAHADPLPLVFVSAEAAGSESASVAVTGLAATQETHADQGTEVSTQALMLRFAPSEDSPVVATIDAGTPVKELATWNGWYRLESLGTPHAIGWSKVR